MLSRLLTICLMTMLIVSCAQTGPAKVEVIDTSCDWVSAIRLTEHDIEVMDRQTKKDILAHNKAWQANCQKSTSSH
ncbi:Lipoprotein [Enterobacter rongchengensis]